MLLYRVISGAIFIFLFMLIVFWDSILASIIFLLISLAILVLSILEFFCLTNKLDLSGYPILTTAAGAALVSILGITSITGTLSPGVCEDFGNMIVFIYLVSLIICIFNEKDFRKGFYNLLVSLGGFVYLVWTLLFLGKIYYAFDLQVTNSRYLFLLLIIVTKASDIGGYFVGKFTARLNNGNHKMVPEISPNKSWEGFVGGIILSIFSAFVMIYCSSGHYLVKFSLNKMIIISVVLGILLTIIGLIGDLSVSVLKRATAEKDSGAVIPGFGGMLDVVDSLIFVSPFFYYFIKLGIRL